MRHAVIMAGGSGTRLWPLSRGARPKQLLAVVGGKSLLRLAYERMVGLVEPDRIRICTGSAYRDAVLEHLPELTPDQLIGEPIGRDTANAVALAGAVIEADDPDAVIAFVTSDHVIEPIDGFQNSMRAGFETAEALPDALVTFGIVPTSPNTGLGYIEVGDRLDGAPDDARAVTGFTEKPDADVARRYVDSGRFWWNSGMFVWRARTVLDAMASTLPDSVTALRQVAAHWHEPDRDDRLAAVFPQLTKISVDYALLEPTARGDQPDNHARVVVVPLRVDWLDVGSWPALAQVLRSDLAGNVVEGVSVLVSSEGNIIVSDDPTHLVATVGVTDMIVVHTRDVTMVCPRAEAQRVKELVARVEASHGARFS